MKLNASDDSIRLAQSFTSSDEPLPIGEIAVETEFTCALPACSRVHGVSFTAFRVGHASMRAARAVDVRAERVAMGFHLADKRLHLNNRPAEVGES